MRLFEKILCPVDFSENSVTALQWTEFLAREYGSKVVLLHVVDLYRVAGDVPVDYDTYYESVGKEFQNFVSPIKVKYQRMLSTGEPSNKILSLARGLDASLIVMGTRGLHGTAHRFLGSNAENVIRHSPVPVMTVSHHARAPHHMEGEGRVLLPIPSLEWPARGYIRLRKIVRELEASVSLMHVVDLKSGMFDATFDANPFLVTTVEMTERKQELQKIGMRISPQAETLDALIQFGDASQEILKEADTGRYSYILMGARKRKLLARIVESTVYKIISEAGIPVLTISVG